MTAILGLLAANPLKTGLGVIVLILGLICGGEYVDIKYKTSEISNLNVKLDTETRLVADWQAKFGQLQTAANDQNAKIAELEAKDADLENKVTASNTQIDNYEKELTEDSKKIADQVLPTDCSAALNVLVNTTKTNVGKLKIERPNR